MSVSTIVVSLHRVDGPNEGWVAHLADDAKTNLVAPGFVIQFPAKDVPAGVDFFAYEREAWNSVAYEAIKKWAREVGREIQIQGGIVKYSNLSAGQAMVEVDIEYPIIEPKRVGVPTSPWQTLLDKVGITTDSAEYDHITELAIEFLGASGITGPEGDQTLDYIGDPIGEELQTALMMVCIRLGATRFCGIVNLMQSAHQYVEAVD